MSSCPCREHGDGLGRAPPSGLHRLAGLHGEGRPRRQPQPRGKVHFWAHPHAPLPGHTGTACAPLPTRPGGRGEAARPMVTVQLGHGCGLRQRTRRWSPWGGESSKSAFPQTPASEIILATNTIRFAWRQNCS